MWSAPIEDLSSWRDEGAIFTYEVDGQWDVMYAPDLVEIKRKDGTKEYYLYPHSRGENREAMVAKGNRPDGPFTPINLTDDGRLLYRCQWTSIHKTRKPIFRFSWTDRYRAV